MSFPILYKANETSFSHMGLGVLNDAISCLVTEERNGLFFLEMEYPLEGAQFKELKNDRLIKVDASRLLKGQRFKIIRISKPMKGKVTVYANHVSYLTEDLALKPDISYSGNASAALATWANAIVDSHPFTTFSNVQTQGSGKWELSKVETARHALGGVSGSLLESYGGEYRFDNYHIGLYAQRGADSGALIAYGRNLTDLTQEETIDSTYTSIYPYSVIQNENEEEEVISLPEYFIDSEYAGNFARRRIRKVDFSEEEITSVSALRARAISYMNQNNFGIPKVNLKIEFADLSKVLDTETAQILERIELCDLVTIYFEKFDILSKAKIIRTVWNPLLDRYDSIEAGESRASLAQSIEATVDGKIEEVNRRVTSVQVAANGKNKVFRGPVEPVGGVKNDLWYKPVGDGEIEMYIHDGTMFRLEAFSADALGGTVNFANVNGINFNAANIVTGTLDTLLVKIEGETGHFFIDGNMLKALSKIDPNKYFEITPEGAYARRGALTVERPDGFKVINNGMSVFDVNIQGVEPMFHSPAVTLVQKAYAQWLSTRTSTPVDFNQYSFKHEARFLKVRFRVLASAGATAHFEIWRGGERVASSQTGVTNENDPSVLNGSTLTVDLGVPTGNADTFQIRFRTSVAGIDAYALVTRKWMEG